MQKLEINKIPIFIVDNQIELTEKGIFFSEYTFFIENKNKISDQKTIEATFCKKQTKLPKIDLKQNWTIKSVQVKLLKYLSDSIVKERILIC